MSAIEITGVLRGAGRMSEIAISLLHSCACFVHLGAKFSRLLAVQIHGDQQLVYTRCLPAYSAMTKDRLVVIERLACQPP
jgi:hypothetical protein